MKWRSGAATSVTTERPRPTREGDETRQEQTVDGGDKGWSCSRERRFMLIVAETKNHSQKTTTGSFLRNTTQHSNCFGAAPSSTFHKRTRLNLKLAAVLVSSRCSHLFTKSLIAENTQQQNIVLLQTVALLQSIRKMKRYTR